MADPEVKKRRGVQSEVLFVCAKCRVAVLLEAFFYHAPTTKPNIKVGSLT